MKTHQEIHEAIEWRRQVPTPSDAPTIWNILHALNDRIEELMKRQATFEEESTASFKSAFNAIHDIDMK